MATRAVFVFALATITLPFANTSFAQSFEGGYTYEQPGTPNKEAYYFSRSGEFSWFKLTANGKEVGSGTYTATKESIAFKYTTAQRQFDIQAQSSFKARGSNATIQVNAMRSSGTPFPGLKFILERSNVAGETDLSGTTIVEVRNSKTKDNIRFEVDGYQTSNQPIDLDGMSHFFAVVIDDAIRYRENVVETFKITRSRSKLTLNGPTGQTVFTKIKRKEFTRLYQDN